MKNVKIVKEKIDEWGNIPVSIYVNDEKIITIFVDERNKKEISCNSNIEEITYTTKYGNGEEITEFTVEESDFEDGMVEVLREWEERRQDYYFVMYYFYDDFENVSGELTYQIPLDWNPDSIKIEKSFWKYFKPDKDQLFTYISK